MISDASSFFILLKAIWWSSVHLNCTFLRSKPRSGSESPSRLSTKVPSWLARPRNECKLVREVGLGKSVSAEILDLSGSTPVASIVNPAKSILGPT